MIETDMSIPLVDRGRSMVEQLLRMAQTRLEMLALEIEREKLALAYSFKLALITALCAWLAGFAAILWAALVLPPDVRSKVLAGLFIVFAAAAGLSALALKKRARRDTLFSRAIAQLNLDRASLGSPEP